MISGGEPDGAAFIGGDDVALRRHRLGQVGAKRLQQGIGHAGEERDAVPFEDGEEGGGIDHGRAVTGMSRRISSTDMHSASASRQRPFFRMVRATSSMAG